MPETKESEELQKLKTFLNQLFQFENQDLDFGIYKILNYKKEVIKNFIDTLLVNEVKSQLNILDESEREQTKKHLDELIKDEVIKGFTEAKDDNTKHILKSVSKDKIQQYETLKAQYDSNVSTSNAEPVIYNHLTEFFKRYYDKGDFISKRRYSKNEKYVVPYNGEETFFYWANQDQYYIKSSEFFSKYSFKVSIYPNKECIVNFKLSEVHEESGNTKSESNKYFVLAGREIEQTKDEINIYFEYRSISDDEKNSLGKNQDLLNTLASEKILPAISKNPAYEILKKVVEGNNNGKVEKNDKNDKKEKKSKSKIKYELDRYTNRNKYDFFIHKDLKGFLSRELDFYIKNEMLYLDDLSLFDSETHLEKIKLHLNLIKTFKHIADTIIDFVSQIENFQRKLWVKKKFVINTEYVITLDKLAEYTTQEFVTETLKEVLKNQDQLNEWKELFGKDLFVDWKKIKLEDLKQDMYLFKKLPVDTKHFPNQLKWNILIEFSKKIEIDNELNGLLIHSDNFQGLKLIEEKFNESFVCSYIDPPYNTGSDGFLYKDNFQHSSWLTMLSDRINLSKSLLVGSAIHFISIDQNEVINLKLSLDKIFGSSNLLSIGSVINNLSGRSDDKFLATSNDFLYLYGLNEDKTKFFGIQRIDFSKYKYNDSISKYSIEGSPLRKTGKNSRRQDRKNLYYEIYVSPDYKKLSLVKGNKFWFTVKPIDSKGKERTWTWEKDTFNKNKDSEIHIEVNEEGIITLHKKDRLKLLEKPKSILYKKDYSSTTGTKLLENIIPNNDFTNPKALSFIFDVLTISSYGIKDAKILDYFSGSGTTAHAVMKLNQDGGKRKFILIEQSEYFNNLIIPRIKKIAYSFNWKEGKPEDTSGLGVFFKYQILEQYEDSLENIAFTKEKESSQFKIEYKDYLPKYFLEFETSESKTLLNTDGMQNPFDYKLKVFDNYDYVEKPVDLIETFNYLIGLYVHKYFKFNNQNRDYYFVYGKDRIGNNILCIWRDVKKIDFKKDKEFLSKEIKNFAYDTLYVNSQCAIEGYIQIETVFKNKMN